MDAKRFYFQNTQSKPEMNKVKILRYVVCPCCRSSLRFSRRKLYCRNCNKFFEFTPEGIPSLLGHIDRDTQLSLDKWDNIFGSSFFKKESEKEYREFFLADTKRQILEAAPKSKIKDRVFLEMGCGQGFLGEAMAKEGWFFLGVDFSLNALKLLKKRLDKREIYNYLLVQGNVESMPIKNGSIDLLFGGGVIEHFENAQTVINNVYRVLKRDGVAVNALPFFNLGNLVYRSLWGGIPNVPILKQIAELVHIKILGGKHMVFGYELQLTFSQLRSLHQRAGFRRENIKISKFDTHIQLHRIKSQFLRKIVIMLCNKSSLFWPAIKVVANKGK